LPRLPTCSHQCAISPRRPRVLAACIGAEKRHDREARDDAALSRAHSAAAERGAESAGRERRSCRDKARAGSAGSLRNELARAELAAVAEPGASSSLLRECSRPRRCPRRRPDRRARPVPYADVARTCRRRAGERVAREAIVRPLLGEISLHGRLDEARERRTSAASCRGPSSSRRFLISTASERSVDFASDLCIP